jgi:hypothetical protein
MPPMPSPFESALRDDGFLRRTAAGLDAHRYPTSRTYAADRRFERARARRTGLVGVRRRHRRASPFKKPVRPLRGANRRSTREIGRRPRPRRPPSSSVEFRRLSSRSAVENRCLRPTSKSGVENLCRGPPVRTSDSETNRPCRCPSMNSTRVPVQEASSSASRREQAVHAGNRSPFSNSSSFDIRRHSSSPVVENLCRGPPVRTSDSETNRPCRCPSINSPRVPVQGASSSASRREQAVHAGHRSPFSSSSAPVELGRDPSTLVEFRRREPVPSTHVEIRRREPVPWTAGSNER